MWDLIVLIPDHCLSVYYPNFKHLSIVVLVKKIFFIFMYFYGFNLGPPVAGPSWTQ